MRVSQGLWPRRQATQSACEVSHGPSPLSWCCLPLTIVSAIDREAHSAPDAVRGVTGGVRCARRFATHVRSGRNSSPRRPFPPE